MINEVIGWWSSHESIIKKVQLLVRSEKQQPSIIGFSFSFKCFRSFFSQVISVIFTGFLSFLAWWYNRSHVFNLVSLTFLPLNFETWTRGRDFFFNRSVMALPPVLVKSHAKMAAAGTIRVWMEEPAMRSVSPPAFDTTVLVRNRFLENTARFSREVVKTTKQLGWTCLDCMKLLMMTMILSKYSVILIQSLDLPGIWSNHLLCLTRTIFR